MINVEVPGGADLVVYLIIALVAIIVAVVPAWLNSKHIASIDLSNREVLEQLLEDSPTIAELKKHDANDLDAIKDIDARTKTTEELGRHTFILTLQQCIYSHPTSREKHESIIDSTYEYLDAVGDARKASRARIHLKNLEADFAWRDKHNQWDYSECPDYISTTTNH